MKILFFTGLVLYFLIVVVARTPAQWGAWGLVQAVPNLTLAGVTGTVWSGKAAGAQVNLQGKILDLGSLNWQLRPSELLMLRACADIDSDRISASACRGLSGKVKVQRLLADRLPTDLFNDRLAVALGGTGGVTLEQATISDNGVIEALNGNVTWQNARVNAGDGWFALGSFAADLSAGDNGSINARVTDIEGPFTVDMSAQYLPGAPNPRINGTIKPKPNAPAPLVNALSLFAQPTEDDAFEVTFPMGG